MKESLEKRLNKIETRSKDVGLDKAWETSFTRRGLLTIFTYLAIGFYLMAIGVNNPWQRYNLQSLSC